MTTARQILDRILPLADPAKAAHLQRFFKTAPGQYAAGDVFLGIPVPRIREIVRDARRASLPLAELQTLLADPRHEVRLCALLLTVEQFKRATPDARATLVRFYLENARLNHINNWDLVDLSAPNILGQWLLPATAVVPSVQVGAASGAGGSPVLWTADAEVAAAEGRTGIPACPVAARMCAVAGTDKNVCPTLVSATAGAPERNGSEPHVPPVPDRCVLHRLAADGNLWEQRIAIVATLAFIRAGQFDDTLALARQLLSLPPQTDYPNANSASPAIRPVPSAATATAAVAVVARSAVPATAVAARPSHPAAAATAVPRTASAAASVPVFPRPHDLLQKAAGWMLREIGKRDRAVLTAFLEFHASALPRTALRYAIEHYPEPRRRHYLAARPPRPRN